MAYPPEWESPKMKALRQRYYAGLRLVDQGVPGDIVLSNVLWPTPEFWELYRRRLELGHTVRKPPNATTSKLLA